MSLHITSLDMHACVHAFQLAFVNDLLKCRYLNYMMTCGIHVLNFIGASNSHLCFVFSFQNLQFLLNIEDSSQIIIK